MGTLGLRLRNERESRGLGRVDVARATKVWIHRLAALEHEDYDALTGEDPARDLRTYAEYLGMDPDAAVAEFLDEVGTRQPAVDPDTEAAVAETDAATEKADAETPAEEPEPQVERESAPAFASEPEPEPVEPEPVEPADVLADSVSSVDDVEIEATSPTVSEPVFVPESEPGPEVEPPPALVAARHTDETAARSVAAHAVETVPARPLSSARHRPALYVTLAGLLLVLLWVAIGRKPSQPEPVVAPEEARPTIERAEPDGAGPHPPTVTTEGARTAGLDAAGATPQPPAAESSAPVEVAPPPSPAARTKLTIPDHGVGTAVENNRLVGSGDSFREGTRIFFWNRVLGGEAGQKIRHVWTKDGRVIAGATLELGGPHWRTYSRKTLYPGSVGSWTVEAFDEAGNVLARREFTCTP